MTHFSPKTWWLISGWKVVLSSWTSSGLRTGQNTLQTQLMQQLKSLHKVWDFRTQFQVERLVGINDERLQKVLVLQQTCIGWLFKLWHKFIMPIKELPSARVPSWAHATSRVREPSFTWRSYGKIHGGGATVSDLRFVAVSYRSITFHDGSCQRWDGRVNIGQRFATEPSQVADCTKERSRLFPVSKADELNPDMDNQTKCPS